MSSPKDCFYHCHLNLDSNKQKKKKKNPETKSNLVTSALRCDIRDCYVKSHSDIQTSRVTTLKAANESLLKRQASPSIDAAMIKRFFFFGIYIQGGTGVCRARVCLQEKSGKGCQLACFHL